MTASEDSGRIGHPGSSRAGQENCLSGTGGFIHVSHPLGGAVANVVDTYILIILISFVISYILLRIKSSDINYIIQVYMVKLTRMRACKERLKAIFQ